jgi:hypothetical protein
MVSIIKNDSGIIVGNYSDAAQKTGAENGCNLESHGAEIKLDLISNWICLFRWILQDND